MLSFHFLVKYAVLLKYAHSSPQSSAFEPAILGMTDDRHDSVGGTFFWQTCKPVAIILFLCHAGAGAHVDLDIIMNPALEKCS